jgi:hypothetical protein
MKKINYFILVYCLFALRSIAQETEYRSLFGPSIAVKEAPKHTTVAIPKPNLIDQSQAEVDRKSKGCIDCHNGGHAGDGKVGDPHNSPNVRLGCIDCHGGDATQGLTMKQAHIMPKNPVFFESAANPSDSTVLLNHESSEFIQFVNPGDLRVAKKACGTCHAAEVDNVGHSMMRHGAMLWGAAAYNNGAFYLKDSIFGQAYGENGAPLALKSPIKVTPEMQKEMGIVDTIFPLPRFSISQPGNLFRVFEKGGVKPLELGNPDPFEPPGRPFRRLSDRGLGTLIRVDPVIIGAHKTRLHDPLLDFFGSNDRAGDYRSSGCTACHVVYANDRSPSNSGWYSAYGNQGLSFNEDKMISKKEKGHPIEHKFTRSIPSSQCMTCHMHQGNLFVNPYLGYTWWDQESDGDKGMYPKEQKNPTDKEMALSLRKNPEAAAARGNWGDNEFLEKVAEKNPELTETQFADYHGHGWVFRAVFKKDRQGNLLTKDGEEIKHSDKDKFKKAVHLKDVHLSLGMQCVDCHFLNDVHGNGLLYVEPRAATAIMCVDCHGTSSERPSLMTSGTGGTLSKEGKVEKIDLRESTTPFGPRFWWSADGKTLYQQSTMEKDMVWEIPQTIDTVNPKSKHYNPMSAFAKTLKRDGKSWGSVPDDPKDCQKELAHSDESMDCQTCHTSWATSCFGCHIPMEANYKVQANKFEGTTTRNYSSYNPQVVRDDVFMLGKDSTVKGNRMAVLRSSSAMVVGSQGSNREWFYTQQQTVSAEGYSGQAFNPHFAHTTSSVGTTKNCTDCHLSDKNDNNAIMTQLLGFGTGTVNFFGRFTYVGTESKGLYGVAWTERSEPQAAIGSYLHSLAYPDYFKKHQENNSNLETGFHHTAKGSVTDLQLRGEYLFATLGKNGFGIFDVANIDNKNFSERIVATPFSSLGHDTFFDTHFATSVVLPSTLINDSRRVRIEANQERPIPDYHSYAFITDLKEGLIVTDVATMVDGNPENNFIKKDVVFNPNGALDGAQHGYMTGQWIYITTAQGLAVVDVADPLAPRLAGSYNGPALRGARQSTLQWRYLFVTDEEGLKVFDVSAPANPRPIASGTVRLGNANGLYVARTYIYVANGSEGLAIIDITNPERPGKPWNFNGGGQLSDTRDVQVGSVNASMFAIVADGLNGLKIIQLISPENVPGHMGFSPKPNPKFIATYHTKGAALAVSRGLDRDRVVDESGGQTVVFGRRGSGPFSLDEMKVFFRKRSNGEYGEESLERNGDFYKVADIKRGTNGDLLDHHGAVLEPDDEFKMPESALDDDDEETPNNSGSTKRRRAPKNLRE